MKNFKKYLYAVLALFTAMYAGNSFAVDPATLTDLGQAVSFTDLKAGVLALFGSMATIAVLMLGGSILLSKLGWRRS